MKNIKIDTNQMPEYTNRKKQNENRIVDTVDAWAVEVRADGNEWFSLTVRTHILKSDLSTGRGGRVVSFYWEFVLIFVYTRLLSIVLQ